MRLRRSRLTEEQGQRLLDHFVAGTSARAAAELAGVNRNSARLFYHRLREIIAQQLAHGAIAVDVSGFVGDRKFPLFALVKEGRRVHVVKLQAAAGPAAWPDAVIYADASELPPVVDVSLLHHERAGNRRRLARERTALDNIENFWGQARRHLGRYNGVPRQHLPLFLKECEWRFNFGSPRQLKKTLESWLAARTRRA